MSSLSGFSTNSHLDEGTEENVAKDDKPHPDPFAPTSGGGGADPFAAFSLPAGSDDVFGGRGFSGRPSDLSAFDPFGGSGGSNSNFDPFKVSNIWR